MQLKKTNLSHIIFDFFFQPVILGLYGFAICFSVLLGIKAITWSLGSIDNIIVGINDVQVSCWGFYLCFVVELIVNLKKRYELIEPSVINKLLRRKFSFRNKLIKS